MAKHSESIAPDRTVEWFDGEDGPLPTYCANVDCSPSTPCKACIAAKPCYYCGRPSVTIEVDPFCAECGLQNAVSR